MLACTCAGACLRKPQQWVLTATFIAVVAVIWYDDVAAAMAAAIEADTPQTGPAQSNGHRAPRWRIPTNACHVAPDFSSARRPSSGRNRPNKNVDAPGSVGKRHGPVASPSEPVHVFLLVRRRVGQAVRYQRDHVMPHLSNFDSLQ